MAELGTFALLAGLTVCAYGVAAGIVGLRRRDGMLIEASLRAVRAWAALIAAASLVLIAALVGREFRLEFVATVTSRDLPLLYTMAAFWGGHAGSLLLWALILGIYSVLALRSLRSYPHLIAPVAVVLLLVAGFFTAMLAFTSNPFTALQVPPPDGRGLNPLLRNPWMAVHPPTLYFGFVGLTVPYALAMGALVTGRLDQTWVTLARRWVLAAWMFLTLGLLFGAKWSYVVLGWGGYWAWDPVENAALMPWLASTAFLHSIQVQERRGLLATWTLALIIISFGLSIFGTFLTRSGVLSSVHAFANSAIGVYFLIFLSLVILGSFGLLFWRWNLMGGGRLEGLFNRETAFLLNNLVLVSMAFVVFTGTIFPVLAEAVTGDRINVGPPYFNQVMAPLVILLLLLMGIGPLLAWRRADAGAFGRTISVPAAVAILAGLVLAAVGVRSPGSLGVLGLSTFGGAAVAVEFLHGVRLRRAGGESAGLALGRLILNNRRRYGGYIVHLGVLLILAGVTVSSAYATQVQVTLQPGEQASLGPYTLRYHSVQAWRQEGLRVTSASLFVTAGQHALGEMRPQHLYHEVQDQPTSEIALRSTWRDDLYLVLVGVTSDQRATFRIMLNPMVSWIWFGGGVVLTGTLIALLPLARRRPVPAVQRDVPVSVPAEAQGIGGGSR